VLLLSPGMCATTYTFSAPNYTVVANDTTCTVGTCGSFTTAMTVAGSFTTSSPLAANLANHDITSQVTSFTFSNGMNTFSSGDPNVRVYSFTVDTDAAGTVTPEFILLEAWTTGVSPHTTADRLNSVVLEVGLTLGERNVSCTSVGMSPTGTADACLALPTDSSSSVAQAAAGTFTSSGTTAIPVPTLSKWGLTAIAGILTATGCWSLRRRAA